ncbi:hypothetical protein HYY71_02045 [Candidatus Woesearchaeota archaeon]|nr:hypothetical protein [Candidatus Woesearchaeota archaeon]
MAVAISPVEMPSNLDKVHAILEGLEKLAYFGPYVNVWFAYRHLFPEIQRRYDCTEVRGRSRFEPIEPAEEYKEIFSATPRQARFLMTSPYPVKIDVSFMPQTWKDGLEIYAKCPGAMLFRFVYWIKLNEVSNKYHISKEPESYNHPRRIGGDFEFVPVTGFDSEGIPLPCLEHYPFAEICVPRFKELRRIFDASHLPRQIQGFGFELSDFLREKGL